MTRCNIEPDVWSPVSPASILDLISAIDYNVAWVQASEAQKAGTINSF